MVMDILPKPKEAQWTDEQWKAIVSSNRDILVAAAAGSGKTAVLVERMIHKIVKEHVDVDRLLVVTFTNASAAEMRHRIGEALEKQLEKKPASLHLRRQLSLLNRASISTIHSFCLDVVRNYYYVIDIDPSFRIADTTEIQLMQEEVLESLFEEEYGNEANDAFFDLVDRYTSDRTDLALQKLVLDLHEFSRANPEPEKWLDDIAGFYQSAGGEKLDGLPFISMLKKEMKLQFLGAESLLHKAKGLTLLPGGPGPRAVNIEEDLAQLTRLKAGLKKSWDALFEEMQQIHFPRAKTCRGDEYDKDLLENWTKARNKAKEIVQDIKSELFSRRPDSFVKDLEELAPVMAALVDLVKKYGIQFNRLKQEKGLVDFSDLEHLCLSILRQKTEAGWERTEAALKYQSTFKEVLVDEYQDTNMVQEAILKLVTFDDEQTGNMFMVGDVKQSIYRFRLAEPFLFLNKYKRFHSNGEGTGLRIDLNRNFRSRTEVLDATNFIFKQIMGETVGEIVYDEDAELKFGASNYPEAADREAELLIINRSDHSSEDENGEEMMDVKAAGFDQSEMETAQVEAKMITQKIKQLIHSGYEIFDKEEKRMRPVKYRDCVVLMRSMPWAPQFMEEFKQEGIPLYANLSTGYFEATEVAVLLSLLKIIDNPYQDIPLASVLRSPIVGLDSDELASIRLQQRKGTYFDALLIFLQKTPDSPEEKEAVLKVRAFYELLQQWRTAAREGALSELIWGIYQDTHFYDFVGGMPGGKQRQANLRALYDRARQYESTSFRGLFRFLRFIERMQDRGEDLGAARALGEQEDVVRLMTIHSSKGLEFPIVFVAGLSKQFNMMDLNSSYLLDKELGFASKFVNARLRITYPTIMQLALKRKAKSQLIAEEMRVLYVALTRAKEKLYLVGTVKDMEKSKALWNEHAANESLLLPDYARAAAKSYMDWIGPAVVRHKNAEVIRESALSKLVPEELINHPSSWKISIIQVQALLEEIEAVKEKENNLLARVKHGETVEIESPLTNKVWQQLYWQYPFKAASQLRSKQSVSELKRMKELQDPYADDSVLETKSERKYFLERPVFLQKKALSPSEIGTAMHAVMQHLSLQEGKMNRDDIQGQIFNMVEKELLTAEQAGVIEIEAIMTFFATSIGQQLLLAKKVYREVPFSYALHAKELNQMTEPADETVLVQGVIDCLLEDDGGLVLIDYKTDAITGRFQQGFEEAEPILRNRYKEQLSLYGKAVEQIWKKKLTAKYLYFFDGNHLVKVE